MRTKCPRCQAAVVQKRNRDGPNFCPNCHWLFYVFERTVPEFVLVVLVILVANLQMLNQ